MQEGGREKGEAMGGLQNTPGVLPPSHPRGPSEERGRALQAKPLASWTPFVQVKDTRLPQTLHRRGSRCYCGQTGWQVLGSLRVTLTSAHAHAPQARKTIKLGRMAHHRLGREHELGNTAAA